MKKYLIMALMAVTAIGAAAQVRTSRTFTRQKSNTVWYVRAGVNVGLPSISGEDNTEDENTSFSGKAGFDVDFGFQKPFGSSNAYWGMELGIGSRGANGTYKTFDDWSDEWDEEKSGLSRYNVVFSPITIGYKFPLTDDLKLDGHVGAFASYDFSSSYDNMDDDDNGTSFDAGMQIGVGAWYKRFNFDITYQLGLVNCYEEGDFTMKLSKLMFRVGFAF